jgi:succinate dehydrogenase / fumarate reductase cytochrome b subunit
VPASRSIVALKTATAISGLVMVLFLLVHMYGDLKVFSGRAAFDDYARYLRTMGEPFLPYSGALWIIRVVLLASVLVHIYAAVTLWRRARRATAGRSGWR